MSVCNYSCSTHCPPRPTPVPKVPIVSVPSTKPYNLSFDGLTEVQVMTILQLTSIFENSTTELQFSYVEDIHDGRGYTFGFVGFCSGTYDGSQMLAEFSKLIGNSDPETTKYLNSMKAIDAQGKGMNSSLIGLEKFPEYVKRKSLDFKKEWIQAQLNVADKLYVKPSQIKAKELKLSSPLAKGQLYDCYLNQGESGGIELIKKTSGSTETEWITSFLTNRYNLLAQDPTWSSSVDRITVYRELLKNNKDFLIRPIKVKCYGESFTLV